MDFTGEFYVPEQHGNIELEHLHRYLQATEAVAGKAVLDIACGEGYGSLLLATKAAHVTGVDISDHVITHAQSRYVRDNLTFRVGRCDDMPVSDQSVDVVVSFETLEHHAQHNVMMREVKRVLRPDGFLLISTPDKLRYSVEPATSNPFHVKELLEDEFKGLIRSHFRNAAFFGQRIAYGSTILSDEGPTPTTCYWRDAASREVRFGNNRPRYWIALASDGPVPDLATGLFEQPIDESETVAAWRGAASDAERSAVELRGRADSLTATIQTALAQLRELRAIVTRSRTLAQRRQHQLSLLKQALAADRLAVDQAKAQASERQHEVVRLRALEVQLTGLRATRLVRLRNVVREEPPGFRKLVHICKRSLALLRPGPREGPKRLPYVGSASSRQPDAGFDPYFYLKSYPDVAAAGVEPLTHYIEHGRAEGRLPMAPALPAKDEQFWLPHRTEGHLPLVSVIVPAYNHAEFLDERLASIYEQTYAGPVEVVLLDDASTDGSLTHLNRWAKRYSDRTTVVGNVENSGSAFRQWRRGLALAKGQVVWIAESDDWSEPGFLATLVPLMDNPAVMLAFTRTLFFRETRDNVVYTLEEYLHDLPDLRFDVGWVRPARELIYAGFYDRNIVPNVSGALLRHPGDLAFLDDVEWQGMQLAGDWMFYLELIQCGLVAFSPDSADYHRSAESSLTTQVGKTTKLAEEVDQVRSVAERIYGRVGGVTDFLPTNRGRPAASA